MIRGQRILTYPIDDNYNLDWDEINKVLEPFKKDNLNQIVFDSDDQIIFISSNDDKPIKLVYENEYPCPVSYQLGFNHRCKYVDQIITEKEITFSCNNIGCEECFLEKKEEKYEKTN
jgi:hypothetical protein